MKQHIFLLALLLCITACAHLEKLRQQIRPPSPYQKYAASLAASHLDQTALGRDWLTAGQRALHDSLSVSLPFLESAYFLSQEPAAYSYRLQAKHGEQLIISVKLEAGQAVQLFMDLFELEGGDLRPVAHGNNNEIIHEVARDAEYLLRLQPELLRSGRYTLSILGKALLLFPVQGKTRSSVSSFFGDPRDAGARRHEGIDIPADRGTPVIAAIDGYISQVKESTLGGKTIWLQDNKHQQSLYYAHLDVQLAKAGQLVKAGDTIGLVGDTGNARLAGPHLHFGVSRGAAMIDPFPLLSQPLTAMPPIRGELALLGNWMRVAGKNASLYAAPVLPGRVLSRVQRHSPVKLLAGSAACYRVQLPDGKTGYLACEVLESLDKPLTREKIKKAAVLRDVPAVPAGRIDSLKVNTLVSVLARFGSYVMVSVEGKQKSMRGWLEVK